MSASIDYFAANKIIGRIGAVVEVVDPEREVGLAFAFGQVFAAYGTIEVMRRDTLEKETLPIDGIENHVACLMDEMQKNIYRKAFDYRASVTREVDSYDDFKVEIEKGGFLSCHWDGTTETEERIKAETKATIRCIPLDGDATPGLCMVTGRPSAGRVLFARSY